MAHQTAPIKKKADLFAAEDLLFDRDSKLVHKQLWFFEKKLF